MKLYQALARTIQAYKNCIEKGSPEWEHKHKTRIDYWVKNNLPSGSGIDCGCQIDIDACTPNKLVIAFSYHHMDENGSYSGWTEHTAIITPSLTFDFDTRITGRDKNGVKDYLSDVFYNAMLDDVNEFEEV